MAKTYQDIQNELGVNEGNSIVELIAKMNDYNVVSPSEITKIISVSVDRLENQVTGKAKEVKRRMYEPVTDDTKGIVSVLNKRIVLLDMIINKLKLEALDILNQHRTNYSNPHKVTKTQVGLNNVDNTSDLDKPISKATQTALNEISSDLDTHKNNTSNPHNVTKAQVGLSSVLDKEQLGKQEKAVDSDKLNGQKADYYAVKENVENEAAYDLDFSMDSSNYVLTVYLKNKSGVVLTQKSIDLPLETMVIGGRYDNETKKIILTLRGVDVPVEFSVADLISGLQGEINENNKLRVELIDGLTKAYLGLEKVINKGMDDKPTANSDNYVKSGGVYSELNKKIDKSQGSSNANKVFMTDASGNFILVDEIPSNSLPETGVSVDTAKQLEKTDGTKIGADEVALKKDFNNVDNTSDMDKPISTAQQQALDLKADKKDVSEVDIDLEGTGTIVSIPENTTGYGTIEKLGGKSYKSANLLVLEDKAETTTNGITYSIKNGVITLNGTASSNFTIYLNLQKEVYLNGSYTIGSFNLTSNRIDLYFNLKSGGYTAIYQLNVKTSQTITYTDILNRISLFLVSGSTYNLTIKLMLVSGSIAPTEFSQGFEGIKIEYPTNVKVVGANVLNVPNITETTIDGITYSITNGELKMKGTTTINYWKVYIPLSSDLEIGQYLFTSYGSGVSSGTTLFFENVNSGNEYVDFAYPLSTNKQVNFSKTIKYIRIYIHSSGISIDFTSKLLLTKNATAPTTFRPYIEPQLLPQTSIINYVSTQLQTNHSWTQENASKWLGLGVGNDSNIINYANKKAIVKYGIVDLGTLSWDYDTNYSAWSSNGLDFATPAISNSVKADIVSNKYTTDTVNNIISSGHTLNTIGLNNLISPNVWVYNGSSTETPTGLLIYELATPIEIDLSSLETEEHFECESNGSIIHDNIANYKYSFPVSLKGQVELNFEHDKEQQRDIDSLKKEIEELDNNKVDKVDGKGLSTNDFTNELKSKLDNLSNYDDTIIKNEIASIKERLDWIEKYFVAEGSIIVSGTATELDSDGKYYYSGSFTVDGTVKSAQIISTNAARFDITYSENIINYKLYASSVRELSANIEYTFVKQGL